MVVGCRLSVVGCRYSPKGERVLVVEELLLTDLCGEIGGWFSALSI